jgi:uncharacterized protein YjiS (DUF1127 family)
MPSQNVSTLAGLRARRDLQGHKNHIGSPLIEAGARYTIGSVFRIISRWVDRSNQRNTLADLDDHLLRDIGVSDRVPNRQPRGAIEEVHEQLWR